MKYLFVMSACLFAQASFAQEKLTVLEPLKPMEAVATATPTDPSQQPGQGPSQGPGQGPGQGPTQNPGKPPRPGKGGKGGGGEYGGGSAEYDQIYYTPAYISKMIANDMRIQCYRGLCEMAMVDTRGQAFVAEVYAGYGNQMMGGGGMGGGGGGSGGGVVVVGSGSLQTNPQPYFGVTLRYVAQHCRQSVRVPTSLYVSMNTYLYNLINEDGTTKRTFDPAEQTMILFYTTVLKQATGCTTPTR